jgi:hypothetical protein
MSNMNVLTRYMIYKLHGNGRHEMTSHKDKNILIKLKKTKLRQYIT